MIIFQCQCDALDKQIKMENYRGNRGENETHTEREKE